MWLWPSLGTSLTNIDPGMWLNTPDISTETNNGKCLRLSYDRNLHRYALQVTNSVLLQILLVLRNNCLSGIGLPTLFVLCLRV